MHHRVQNTALRHDNPEWGGKTIIKIMRTSITEIPLYRANAKLENDQTKQIIITPIQVRECLNYFIKMSGYFYWLLYIKGNFPPIKNFSKRFNKLIYKADSV